jgi:hypothetical protein
MELLANHSFPIWDFIISFCLCVIHCLCFLSFCLIVLLSFCLFVSVSFTAYVSCFPSFCLSVCLSFCFMSFCLYVFLSISLSVSPSLSLSFLTMKRNEISENNYFAILTDVFLSVFLSASLSVFLSASLSVCLSAFLTFAFMDDMIEMKIRAKSHFFANLLAKNLIWKKRKFLYFLKFDILVYNNVM